MHKSPIDKETGKESAGTRPTDRPRPVWSADGRWIGLKRFWGVPPILQAKSRTLFPCQQRDTGSDMVCPCRAPRSGQRRTAAEIAALAWVRRRMVRVGGAGEGTRPPLCRGSRETPLRIDAVRRLPRGDGTAARGVSRGWHGVAWLSVSLTCDIAAGRVPCHVPTRRSVPFAVAVVERRCESRPLPLSDRHGAARRFPLAGSIAAYLVSSMNRT